MMPIARIGDKHLCPICGPNMIVEGGTATIDGIPVARVGDKTLCTAVITVGSTMLFDDNRPVAYVGALTSHGGVIAQGAPRALTLP